MSGSIYSQGSNTETARAVSQTRTLSQRVFTCLHLLCYPRGQQFPEVSLSVHLDGQLSPILVAFVIPKAGSRFCLGSPPELNLPFNLHLDLHLASSDTLMRGVHYSGNQGQWPWHPGRYLILGWLLCWLTWMPLQEHLCHHGFPLITEASERHLA